MYFPSLVSERGKEGHNVTPPIYIVAGGKAGPAFGPLAEKSEGIFGNILLLDFYFNLATPQLFENIKPKRKLLCTGWPQ